MVESRSKIRILIVEDQALFREMLSEIVSEHPRLELVGVVADGESALKATRRVNPDVVVMDIQMPGPLNGIQAGIKIKSENPKVGILVLSAHKDLEYISNISFAYAVGWSYLLKQSVADIDTLVRAIEGCAGGLMVVDPQVVAGLRPRKRSRLDGLTPRQLEVIQLVAQGFSNAAIAGKLTLSEKSIENNLNAIYQGLGITASDAEAHARVKATLTYLEESRKV